MVWILVVVLYSATWEQHYCLLVFAVGGLDCRNWLAVSPTLLVPYAHDFSMGPYGGGVSFCKPLRYAL